MSKTSSSPHHRAGQALFLLASGLLCLTAAGQPAVLLNDTGQTQCDNGSNVMVACDADSTGDASTMPRQDGRFGRDVASPTKAGGGDAGFDFTPLDASGNPIALTGTPAVPTVTPRCVKDNVTNLIWEVKTSSTPASGLQDSTYTYVLGSYRGINSLPEKCGRTLSRCNTDAFVAAINAANLCGETANDWRLPTRRELLSIVHNGSTGSIDVSFFPNTTASWYMTSDIHARFPGQVHLVNFGIFGGATGRVGLDYNVHVRLVRSGQ